MRIQRKPSLPVKWLIFCVALSRMMRSNATDVSVQYTCQSSSSPTSFHPSFFCTMRTAPPPPAPAPSADRRKLPAWCAPSCTSSLVREHQQRLHTMVEATRS
jgi:hypothetical protein